LILLVGVGACGPANKPADGPEGAASRPQRTDDAHLGGSDGLEEEVEPASHDVEVPPAP